MDEDTEPTPQEALDLAAKIELKGIVPRPPRYLWYFYFSAIISLNPVVFAPDWSPSPVPRTTILLHLFFRLVLIAAGFVGIYYRTKVQGFVVRSKSLPRILKIHGIAVLLVFLSIHLVAIFLFQDKRVHGHVLVLSLLIYFCLVYSLMLITSKTYALVYGRWLRSQQKE